MTYWVNERYYSSFIWVTGDHLAMIYWILTLIAALTATIYQYHALMHRVIHTGATLSQLVHVFLSSFAFSVLCIAALQACLLAWQESQLHHKQVSGILRRLPPLESMEALLSQFVVLGFILLTLVLFTSASFIQAGLTPYLIQKIVLSFLAWGVFAILLWGRYRLGWRGQTLVRWTLWGVGWVVLSYFASQFITTHHTPYL